MDFVNQNRFNKKFLLDIKKLFDSSVDKGFFVKHLEKIVSYPKWIAWWYFMEKVKNFELIEQTALINYQNFTDFMEENEVLLEFPQDKWVKFEWTRPWTKAWFEERPERREYLKPEFLETFQKFGTIQALMIVEWVKSKEDLEDYYENLFKRISLEKSRNTILQIAEAFNLLLRRGKFDLLNEIFEGFWDKVKDFIDTYKISDKWATIITLLIAKNIRDSFQIWKDPQWEQQVDYTSLKWLLENVKKELDLYLPIIEKYQQVDIKTSIWVEIEIWPHTAKWYQESTGWDYKQDIIVLSEYSWIGQWYDAIHEIATKPTDNPALLLLELQLLEELDFLDLNFKKPEYEKWARWLHLSIGGEYGLELDEEANMIQNLMIITNWWWLNAWKEVKRINKYKNIRKRWNDIEPIFGDYTSAVEFRSLSIDKKEPLERMIFAMFKLAEAKQLKDKYLKNTEEVDLENFKKTAKFSEEISDTAKMKIYKFLKLKEEVKKTIQNHNENFENNETLEDKHQEQLARLLMHFTSTSPSVKIMKEAGLSVYKFKEIFESWVKSESEFFEEVGNSSLTDRQKRILWENYKLRIKPEFERLKKESPEIYKNLENYLNWNIEDTLRRITNAKRFQEVIWNDKNYFSKIKIPESAVFDVVNPDFINALIRINNLFIKKDSINALAMYDTTTELNWEKITSGQASETNIFEKVRKQIPERKWYYTLQWASEEMLVHRIQKLVLEFLED